MATISHDFIEEFIEILRGESAIWESKSENYKNKTEKMKSWKNLLEKYKEIDESATIESVKKKYNALRASYRRELAKIKKSEKSGASAEDIYVPSLWYFSNMDFLRDQETQIDGINTYENETEKEPRAKKPKSDESNFLEKAISFLEQPKNTPERDEATIYSEAWAVGFRKMDERQKLFTKRIIDDAILQGQLGNLNMWSSISMGRQSVPHFMHPGVHYNRSNSVSPYSPGSPMSSTGQYAESCSSLSQSAFPAREKNLQIISNELLQSPIQQLLNDPQYQDYD